MYANRPGFHFFRKKSRRKEPKKKGSNGIYKYSAWVDAVNRICNKLNEPEMQPA